MMSFLTAVVTSRYPPTKNQLRNSSNPRQQATINNGRVTVQPIQGRHTSLAASTSRTYTSGSNGINFGKQRTVGEQINDIPKTSQEATLWMKYVYADRPPQLKTTSSDMQHVSPPISREPVFDELDDVIKIKLAEAQLFQTRADDARKETEGLNHIVQAKSKKIDDEFTSRVMKLHLSEEDEMRR
nr:hypothetical protein [Tanacetum cinerariifolium]